MGTRAQWLGLWETYTQVIVMHLVFVWQCLECVLSGVRQLQQADASNVMLIQTYCCFRYCFENDVPINMEGQEAMLDWAFDRMGITGKTPTTASASSTPFTAAVI